MAGTPAHSFCLIDTNVYHLGRQNDVLRAHQTETGRITVTLEQRRFSISDRRLSRNWL